MEKTKKLFADNKWFRIVVIIVVIILAFTLFKSIFADKYAKKAQDAIKTSVATMLEQEGISDIKISAKAIGKNTTADMYCFDVSATGKYLSEKFEFYSYIIVISDKEGVSVYRDDFEYTEDNKEIIREMALAALSRG